MFLDILVGYEVKIEIWGDQRGCERCGYFWSGVWTIENMFFEILTRKVVIVKNVDFTGVQ